ncbi:MAG: protein-L-isoaspartate O-methyltransferase [Pseudomonadota bacterium]
MDTEQARFNMVEQQIRTWDVLDDHVLDIIQSTPREAFVPIQHQSLAFADLEIPLGYDQVMMSPKVEGRMLQALQLSVEDKVLEIGTGSGFVTSCLAKMSRHVTSYEINEGLAEQARRRIKDQNLSNVEIVVADIFHSLPIHNHYDVIAVTGSSPSELDQLAGLLETGGRMFSIIGEQPVMTATLTTCISPRSYRKENLFETSLTSLVMAKKEKEFTF